MIDLSLMRGILIHAKHVVRVPYGHADAVVDHQLGKRTLVTDVMVAMG